MDTARFQQIQKLFLEALDLTAAEREAHLEAACGGDGALIGEVLAMLEADGRGGSMLDGDLSEVARQMLDSRGAPVAGEFGPYRLLRVLGEGGMGVVYLAQRDDLESLAAIKILRDAWLSPARRERFISEQRTLAQLNHPSIARIYDAGSLQDGTPWFVMEYVDGLPLTDYCRANECTIHDRLRLLRSVCEAVRYAHEHAVIHRDLKPSNILVKPGGEVRLLDFGIAKHIADVERPDQTQTGMRLMTPAYAAPEQVRGEQVGIFTDVYALGVILYELLTGQLPAPEQEPAKPSALAGTRASWSDLDVLCLTAMHKEAARRYRSVEALIRDVDHYLKGEPLEARPDSLRYRAGKFLRRNRRAVGVATVAGFAMAALAIFFTVRLAIARNTALAAVARMQRVQQLTVNLFQGGDPSAAPAESLRVITLVDRGLKEAEALSGQPELQADLFLTLGGIYQKLGNLTRADTLLQAALERRKSLSGPQDIGVAECLVALGLLRTEQARLDEAERLVREGLEQTRRARPGGVAAIAKATAALGKVLEARGAYDKAIPVLEEAVRLESEPGQPMQDLAAATKELADAQFYAGHFDLADTLTKRAMELHRRLFGDRHPQVADDLINLGAVRFERGQYAEAEQFYRQALAINEGWYGGNHPAIASNLSMLGRALVFEKKYDEAVSLVERALGIQERVYGAAHPKVANVLNELGTVALQRGKFGEAEARFRRMAEIYKAAYGEHHRHYALALANVASVYLAQKEFVRAEKLFREVVERDTKALSADHPFTGIAQIKLGRALVGQKRYADAEPHTLAGYGVLMKQTSPTVSWLRSARADLVSIYEALHQPDRAAQFRKEASAHDVARK